MQMAGTVCELTFLPRGLLGRIDCAAQKAALADVIDVGLALSTAHAVDVEQYHRWHHFLKPLCQNLLKQNLPFLFASILLFCY